MKSVEQSHNRRVSAKHWVALCDITHGSFPNSVCVLAHSFRASLADYRAILLTGWKYYESYI